MPYPKVFPVAHTLASLTLAACSGGPQPQRPSTTIAGIAVFHSKPGLTANFGRMMGDALEAIETSPGFRYALQLQSLDDPSLFADYVIWDDVASASAAAEVAKQLPVCMQYFAASGHEYLFGHIPSDRDAIPQYVGRDREAIGTIHLIAAHPASHHVSTLADRLRAQPGVTAVDAGVLDAENGTGAAIIAVWSDAAMAERGIAGVQQQVSKEFGDVPGVQAWRFRVRDWFAYRPQG